MPGWVALSPCDFWMRAVRFYCSRAPRKTSFLRFKKRDPLVFHTDRTKTEKTISSCPLAYVGQFGGGVHFDQKCPAVHSQKNASSAPVVLIWVKKSATVRSPNWRPEILSHFFAVLENRKRGKTREFGRDFS